MYTCFIAWRGVCCLKIEHTVIMFYVLPYKSIVKRTMSDQRLAELQALIALRKGHDIPVGHGLIDPWRM